MDHFPDFDALCNEIKNTPLPPLSDAMLDEHAADFEKESFEGFVKNVRSAYHVLNCCQHAELHNPNTW